MNTIQAAEEVQKNGVSLLRLRKDAKADYDVKPAFTGKKKGWFYLDSFTASAIIAVYNALNETNKEKIKNTPIEKVADWSFKFI